MAATPVKSGIDAIVKQNSRTIGWATSINATENFMLEAIVTLGKHGPRGFKSLGYDGSMSCETFVLSPKLNGADVTDNLQTATRRTIVSVTANPSVFDLIDTEALQTFLKVIDAIPESQTLNFAAGQLAAKNTEWKFTELFYPEGGVR